MPSLVSSWRRTRQGIAVVAVLCGAACIDTPQTPMTAPATASTARNTAASASRAGNTNGASTAMHRNAEKYAEHGARPARGRSGNASIMSRAIARRDGTILVDVTTGDFDVPGSAVNLLTKVQAKVIGPDGGKTSTTNYNGLSTPTYTFAPIRATRKATVQIQANVKSATDKTPRTDVVTALDTVWAGADLAVERVAIPDQIQAGEVAHISATVIERNGDIGARADCVLYVDGVRTDVNAGIWVDAGDRVTCTFAARFQTGGGHAVVVAVERVTAFDFDPANNTGTARITVGPTPMQYTATAFEHTGHAENTYTYQYRDDAPGTYRAASTLHFEQDVRTHSTHLYAWVGAPITFPAVGLALGLSTEGTPIDQRTFTTFASGAAFGAPQDGGTCGMDQQNYVTVVVCTYWRDAARWTTVTYDRYAGTVTYLSTQVATYAAAWGSGYYYNDGPTTAAEAWGGSVGTRFGTTVDFTVQMTAGSAAFTAAPRVTLVPNAYTTQQAFCTASRNATNNGAVTECYDIGGQYLDKEGLVYSPGQ